MNKFFSILGYPAKVIDFPAVSKFSSEDFQNDKCTKSNTHPIKFHLAKCCSVPSNVHH